MTLRYRDLPQIPAEQLRTGNIVFDDGHYVTINSVSRNRCRVTSNTPDNKYVRLVKTSDLRPTTVNEWKIELVGFTRIPHHKYTFQKPGFPYHLKYDAEDKFELTYNEIVIAEGTFLHHLQNLVQDLSIKEYHP